MEKMIKNGWLLCGVFVSVVIVGSLAYSHCQIPCGIYGDDARFDVLREHIATVEKSMKQITELSAGEGNVNQAVRWVQNKDKHADEIAHIVTYYFMAQRLKLPEQSDAKAVAVYTHKLRLLHELLVYSMKAKQTTDLENVAKLKASLAHFENAYYGKTNHSGHTH